MSNEQNNNQQQPLEDTKADNNTPNLSNEEIMAAYNASYSQATNDDSQGYNKTPSQPVQSNQQTSTQQTQSVEEPVVQTTPPVHTYTGGTVTKSINPNEPSVTNNGMKFTDTNNMSEMDILFAGAFNNSVQEVKERKIHIVQEFSSISDSFKNEYLVYYTLLKDLRKVDPTEKFLRLYLSTNRAVFSNSPNVNLANFQVSDLDPYVEFVNSVITKFSELSSMVISEGDFYTASEIHKMSYMSEKSIEVLEVGTQILTNGAKVKNKTLTGYEDMRSYTAQEFNKIDNLNNKSDRKGFIIYGSNDTTDEETEKMQLVTRFGIEALDKAIGGLYEGDMLSLLAPAKGGKSRMATYIVHQAILSGQNVVFWSVENGYQGWEALIRARHFEYFYNQSQTDPTKKIIINADQIRKNELPPELKELEKVSYDDLRFNKNHGRILSIDEDFRYESCLTHTENAIDAVQAKLICIDYLQLIDAAPGQSKTDRITEVYKQYLQLCKRKKVAGIFPSQFKQSVVGEIGKKSNDELVNMELRDSAGDSYEVIRTPDINLSLYGSVEDIKNGHMKILSIPSRNSKPFDPIDLHCDLGTCTFASVN